MADKYANDKYDRELYIPKGYIMSSGKSILLFCDEHQNRIIEEAIAPHLLSFKYVKRR